jgi:hypothetical protein
MITPLTFVVDTDDLLLLGGRFDVTIQPVEIDLG